MINSSSLFHFTREFGTFKEILTEGLRFGYCYEPYSDVVAMQGWNFEFKIGRKAIECNGIAIPMICFCDIPLLRTKHHREQYGNYMIGFNREALIKTINSTNYMLNPVQYRCHQIFDEQLEELSIQKNEFICQIESMTIPIGGVEIKGEEKDDLKFNSLILQPDIREKCKELIEKINAIDSIIGFSKPYMGECGYDYMAEREWRIIVPDCNRPTPNCGWRKRISKEQFENFKLSLNDNFPQDLYIHFDDDEITSLVNHIVVQNEAERNTIINLIQKKEQTLFGCDLTEKQRLNLISKITSFEQIEKDY
jgi:hypothetical protein